MIKDNSLLLFIGDSITDYYRKHDSYNDLGLGFVPKIAEYFRLFYPELGLQVLNRGIGGNRTGDLVNRWQTDCIDLKPDYLTILIGINDCWRRYDQGDPTSLELFEQNYRNILEQTKKELTAKLIIMEPFVLHDPADRALWREDLNPKIDIVRKLAAEYEALYIPLDGIFAAACTQKPPLFWSGDGVHPTDSGNALIAKEWLKALDMM